MDGLVDELVAGTREEMAIVAEQGGAVAAVPYMKTQLVESHRERVQRIENGSLKVVGQNVYTEAEPSPLQSATESSILRSTPPSRRPRSTLSTPGAPPATDRPSTPPSKH